MSLLLLNNPINSNVHGLYCIKNILAIMEHLTINTLKNRFPTNCVTSIKPRFKIFCSHRKFYYFEQTFLKYLFLYRTKNVRNKI